MTDFNNNPSDDVPTAAGDHASAPTPPRDKHCCDRQCCGRRRGWGRWVFRALLLIALVFGATAAYKAYRWNNMDSAQRTAYIHDHIGEGVSEKLKLNADQQQRFNALSDLVLSQAANVQPNAMRSKALAVIAGPQFDRAAAQALVNEATQAVQTASPSVIASAADFYDSLSSEQQAKLRDEVGSDRWKRRRSE
jgi:periplasmic protein CpxP/Spy